MFAYVCVYLLLCVYAYSTDDECVYMRVRARARDSMIMQNSGMFIKDTERICLCVCVRVTACMYVCLCVFVFCVGVCICVCLLVCLYLSVSVCVCVLIAFSSETSVSF